MDNFYIIANSEKDEGLKVASRVEGYLKSKGKNCSVRPASSGVRDNLHHYTDINQIPRDVECVIVLGGDGTIVCLIKPQFEAGREKVGKKGVVRDPEVHREVIKKITDFASETGFALRNLEYSPIKGPEGNIEYLLYLQKKQEGLPEDGDIDIDSIVAQAHKELDK